MAYSIVERTDQPYGPWYDFATASGVYNWGYSDANDGAWGYLQLYDSGCKVGNGWNCTAACLDTELGPDLLWNTTNTGYTLQNCIVLPFIAALLAASELTPTAVKLAQKYQIAPDASLFNSSNASAISWPVINNCINQFCEGNGGSTPGCDTSHAPNQDAMLWYTFTPNETYYQDGDGQNYTQNITFDGVRVDGRKKRTYVTDVQSGYLQLWTLLQSQCWMFVSYLMQMFIILSAWLLYHFYETWARWPVAVTLIPFHGARKASMLAKKAQTDLRVSDHAAALVSALDEMQKAQVFFMLAVQIAALIALQNPTYIQATSWQQLFNNYGILFNLAFGGMLPVVFAMLIKRLAGTTAVYTIIVSTCCVIVSSVTWFLTWNANPDPDTSIVYTGPPIPQCAGIAPTKFCYQYGWFYANADATSKAFPMLVFCWVVQLCLILDVITLFRVKESDGSASKGNCFQWVEQKILRMPFWTRYDDKHFNQSRWRTMLHFDTGERMVRLLQSCIVFATECGFVGLNVVLITDYAHLLLVNDFQTLDLKNWTLGQVIAVTIWVPVFLEYLYVAAGGPEAIYKGRLHKDFEVVRKGSTLGEPAPHDHDDREKLSATVSSSAVELTHVEPVTRPGYERVNSQAWP
ncbi:hypothetical protein LTR35_001005 [Friedmanniomyces endolithicus]|uniref:Uncharacterized protein n=1 Tax=Friedmanniomyces endolithicus TaxID=329885 RepID=A0AAN6F968_9PEZI|nr:hypothetical protein LTS00_013163 [Friedmanniomyces endolithicus]KAK0292974.1 hypothetical protein LTR35_001005 [Friedmanniomyces endolithicus]KAK0310243.1 hypothetical protein LTR82_014925 [Friedmanniomyces endolithicus]